MNYLYNLNEHKESVLFIEKFNNISVLVDGVDLTEEEINIAKNIFNKLLEGYRTTDSVKLEIKEYIVNSNILNESFFDKLKTRFPKAAEVSNKLSDKAESVLGKILQATNDALSFIKKISEGIKDLFMKAIEQGKVLVKKYISEGKLKEKISEVAEKEKENLIKDIKTSREVLSFYREKFLGNLLKTSNNNMSDFFSKEQTPVVESMLITEEKGNVIATLVHSIEKVPPFNWLHSVAKSGEAGANKLIDSISSLTQKLGGNSFKLPVIAVLLGVVLEQLVKANVGGWLLTLAGSTTPLGMAIKGIKMTAMVIAFISVLDATLGGQILGSSESH